VNPLLALLMWLRSQGQQGGAPNRSRQGGGVRGAVNQSFAADPNDPFGNYPWSPQANLLLGQLNRDFWNPGGGWMGNDIVGGGQVFGGIYRGPQGSFQPTYTLPNAGWTGFLSGMPPNMGQSPGQSMYDFFGPQGTRGGGYPGAGTEADRPGLGEFFGNIGGMGGELSGSVPQYF
jgi:hypothetical protein